MLAIIVRPHMPSSALEPMYVPTQAPGSSACTVLPWTPTVVRSCGWTMLTWALHVSWTRPAKSMAQMASFHVANPSTAGTSTLSTCWSRIGRWVEL
jgi:hypothetical protein